MRGLAVFSVGALVASLCGACTLYHHPQNGPAEEQVFAAATQVILERYPRALPVQRSGLILALTPVGIDGGYKSRSQITVEIHRLYTGAWEPRVSVVKYVEVGEPTMDADPDALYPGQAHPVAEQKWMPLQRMVSEESDLRDAILRAI